MDDQKLDRLVEAMFQHDQRGRLVDASPLLHVVRTADGAICRCHANMPDSTAAHVTSLAASPRGRPGAWAEDYARYLSLAGGVFTVTSIRAGPLFGFPESLADDPDCVAIGRGNSGLLKGALDELSIGRTDRLSCDVEPVISLDASGTILAHIERMRAAGCRVE